MVSTVGTTKIEPLTTDINKKIEFFLNITLDENTNPVSKITSIMCTPSKIELEKSNTGLLAIINYNLKIIYIEENNETLHVFKSSYTHITDIKTH
ncbi:MAG: hypothetical protein ACRC28_09040, partial [Clostridium sp.]|uniref:hypothetical protein n=1 Tax=Clostridium sp. TaxID=1506 RepID=UPI003F34B288